VGSFSVYELECTPCQTFFFNIDTDSDKRFFISLFDAAKSRVNVIRISEAVLRKKA